MLAKLVLHNSILPKCCYNVLTLIPHSSKKNDQNYDRKHKHGLVARDCNVSIIGLGGVGQGLAHLLKMHPLGITKLKLFNRSDPEGIVQDLRHIPSNVKVEGYRFENISEGLNGTDVVVVTAGQSRKKDAPREALFKENANLCRNIITVCAESCPEAFVAIVSNPVDVLVPLSSEVLKKCGTYCPERVFGVCELDQMRARHFFATAKKLEESHVYVPVVGGHAENTTVPLFSRSKPDMCLHNDEIKTLIIKVRQAGQDIVKAKKGQGGSTWSMASAAMYFVHKLCRAIRHEPHVVASAYVRSDLTEARYFSSELLIGANGIENNLGFGEISSSEENLIQEAVVHLNASIQKGEDFILKGL